MTQAITKLGVRADSVLELGCYDGKLLDYLTPPPARYVGLDANWEGGLDLAWRNRQTDNHEFRLCREPLEMALAGEQFDVSVAMETLEHVPPDLVDPYLRELAVATRGYCFVTVPNEIGLLFIAKYLTKRLRGGDFAAYSAWELVNQTLGRTDRVARDEHKGFDYRRLKSAFTRHFDLVEFSGHPFAWLPAAGNFGIGMIGSPKA
jgi:SAM-dependent methyltransferase